MENRFDKNYESELIELKGKHEKELSELEGKHEKELSELEYNHVEELIELDIQKTSCLIKNNAIESKKMKRMIRLDEGFPGEAQARLSELKKETTSAIKKKKKSEDILIIIRTLLKYGTFRVQRRFKNNVSEIKLNKATFKCSYIHLDENNNPQKNAFLTPEVRLLKLKNKLEDLARFENFIFPSRRTFSATEAFREINLMIIDEWVNSGGIQVKSSHRKGWEDINVFEISYINFILKMGIQYRIKK